MPTDADIIQWLEDNHTLHQSVTALYVVDGYEVTIDWNDSPIKGPYKAETLREAYLKAMEDNK